MRRFLDGVSSLVGGIVSPKLFLAFFKSARECDHFHAVSCQQRVADAKTQVLDLWRSGSKDAVSAVELKARHSETKAKSHAFDRALCRLPLQALLAEIRDASDDPKYWEEVMQAPFRVI